MANRNAIEVKGLGKDYPKAGRRSDFFFKELFRRPETESFTALDGLDFSLEEGKTLGIVGSNGSGKSTLLKIFSRVTLPSRGQIRLSGRVAPLLEVGTGFHPDLSGRDNVFLNGSLLGMNRREVQDRLDEIVAFSGVEEFLDQPVKNYSSGMYFRLAFAVAAHLRAEIMLVDEVLAVGDLAFQQKCLKKMDDLSQSGRTVLLVSHQLENLLKLCDQALWIEKGRQQMMGPTEEVATAYRRHMLHQAAEQTVAERTDRRGSGALRLQELDLFGLDGKTSNSIRTDEPFRLRMKIDGEASAEDRAALRVQLNFYDQNERFTGSLDSGQDFPLPPEEGPFSVQMELPCCPLYAGSYWATARLLLDGRPADRVESALRFDVETGKDAWTHRKSGMRHSVQWKSVKE